MSDEDWQAYVDGLASVVSARDEARTRQAGLLQRHVQAREEADRALSETAHARDVLGARVRGLRRDASATLSDHHVPADGPAAEISAATPSSIADATRSMERIETQIRQSAEELDDARARAKVSRVRRTRVLLGAALAVIGGILAILVGASYLAAAVTAVVGPAYLLAMRAWGKSFVKAMATGCGAALIVLVALAYGAAIVYALIALAVISVAVYFWILR